MVVGNWWTYLGMRQDGTLKADICSGILRVMGFLWDGSNFTIYHVTGAGEKVTRSGWNWNHNNNRSVYI